MSPSSTSSSEVDAGYRDDELIPLCPGILSKGRSRVLGWSVITYFLLVIAGGGFVDQLWPQPLPPVIGREKIREDKERREARLLDGSLAGLFEKDLRQRSTIRHLCLPYYAGLLLRGLCEADPQRLVVGKEGWVFQVQRLNARDGAAEQIAGLPAAMIAALARRFSMMGTELILTVVPRKESIYGEYLRANVYRVRPELYGILQRALLERGVVSADLETLFRNADHELTFLKTDTHWSPIGTVIAAKEASRLAGLLKPETDRSTALRNVGPQDFIGDLVRMAGALRLDGSGFEALKEQAEGYRVFSRGNPRPRKFSAAKRIGDCAVVGTSYTANAARFPDYLSHFTDLDWWVGAWPALGPVEPMRRTVVEILKGLSPGFPRFVVWEIPDGELFCTGAPLEGLGTVMNLLPTKGLDPIAPETINGAGGILSPSVLLKVGAMDLTRDPIPAWSEESRLIHPNDGTVLVSLWGQVTGGPVSVAVDSLSGRMTADWKPDMESLTLPIVGSRLGRRVRVTVRALSGPVRLNLQGISVLTDLEIAAGVCARPASSAMVPGGWEKRLEFVPGITALRNGAAVVDIEKLPPSAYPLAVTVHAADRSVQKVVEIASGGTPHTVIVGLSSWPDRQISAITVAGRGADPGDVVRRASIAAQRRFD